MNVSIRLLVIFFIISYFIFLENTFLYIPVSFVLLFSLSLVSKSFQRFLVPFFCGLFFDSLAGTPFPVMTIYFLVVMFIVGLYRSYLPEHLIVNAIFFLLAEYIFLGLSGMEHSTILLFSGLILLFPTVVILRKFLKPVEESQLEFDLFRPAS